MAGTKLQRAGASFTRLAWMPRVAVALVAVAAMWFAIGALL